MITDPFVEKLITFNIGLTNPAGYEIYSENKREAVESILEID
jgi:hypothetical protein